MGQGRDSKREGKEPACYGKNQDSMKEKDSGRERLWFRTSSVKERGSRCFTSVLSFFPLPGIWQVSPEALWLKSSLGLRDEPWQRGYLKQRRTCALLSHLTCLWIVMWHNCKLPSVLVLYDNVQKSCSLKPVVSYTLSAHKTLSSNQITK